MKMEFKLEWLKIYKIIIIIKISYLKSQIFNKPKKKLVKTSTKA